MAVFVWRVLGLITWQLTWRIAQGRRIDMAKCSAALVSICLERIFGVAFSSSWRSIRVVISGWIERAFQAVNWTCISVIVNCSQMLSLNCLRCQPAVRANWTCVLNWTWNTRNRWLHLLHFLVLKFLWEMLAKILDKISATVLWVRVTRAKWPLRLFCKVDIFCTDSSVLECRGTN